MTQLSLPTDVTIQEIARERTLGDSIALCARAGGLTPKEIQHALRLDKGQWSRWESGAEGVVWPKLTAVMDHCGNDAPVLWMVHNRGWDLASLRRRESEMERELRQAREEVVALRRVLAGRIGQGVLS